MNNEGSPKAIIEAKKDQTIDKALLEAICEYETCEQAIITKDCVVDFFDSNEFEVELTDYEGEKSTATYSLEVMPVYK